MHLIGYGDSSVYLCPAVTEFRLSILKLVKSKKVELDLSLDQPHQEGKHDHGVHEADEARRRRVHLTKE